MYNVGVESEQTLTVLTKSPPNQQIDRLLSGPFMDRAGKKFNYKAFVEAVKMSEPAELE